MGDGATRLDGADGTGVRSTITAEHVVNKIDDVLRNLGSAVHAIHTLKDLRENLTNPK